MKNLTRTNSICLPPETVLLESVKSNDTETIKTLVKSNEDLLKYEYPFTSKTILSTACNEKGVKPETIQTLINLGADVIGNAEWKPLHLAALNPDSSILEVIIKNIPSGHIKDTVKGNTALHTLVKCNAIKEHEEQFCGNIELLLEAGVSVNEGDGKNLSAIFWAAKDGLKSVVKTILETKVCDVDLDSHQLQNKSARDFIKEKQLYCGSLPERILHHVPKDKIFSLIKLAKEDEFIKYFDTLSLTNPSDFVNMDDGTSTLLQYSCKKGLPRVVKYLLNRGANVKKTIINHPKTPLQLAIEHGYYEIIEILIEEPDLEITSITLCEVIKRSDNPKFDKIDHEKCCQIILDKVENRKLDVENRKLDVENQKLNVVNGEDALTNTPIHYSLRYSNDATTEKLLGLGASLASKNKYGKMPIEDIRPELLERHLDDCIKFDISNRNDEKRDFKVVFNYRSLVPYHSFVPPRQSDSINNVDGESLQQKSPQILPETEVINYMSKAPELRALLIHPVIVSFLLIKWHRIRLLFYSNLLFYVVFVSSLITYIFTYYANFTNESSDFCTGLANFTCFTLNLTFWVLVLREMFQIAVSPGNYFRNFENFVETVLIVITGMILYISSPTNDTRKQLASLSILLAAFELVLMVGQHPKLSTNVVMLKTVSVNFFKLLLWYSLLIIAFALSFYILFARTELPAQNSNGTDTKEDDLFTGPGKSLFKTIVMLTGELDAGSINFYTYPITSKIIFSLFVFMITIILLNLLNGLAVSDTQAIKNNAELVGHIARAQHIYYVESMLIGNILPTSLMKMFNTLFCCFPKEKDASYTLLKPLARRICLFTPSCCELVVLPNNHGRIFCEFEAAPRRHLRDSCTETCANMYLDKQTVKRINCVVKTRRDKANAPVVGDVEKLFAEILALRAKYFE